MQSFVTGVIGNSLYLPLALKKTAGVIDNGINLKNFRRKWHLAHNGQKKVGYKILLWRKKEKKCSWSIMQNIYFPRLSKRKILRRQDKWVFYVFLGTYRTESGISPNRKIKEGKNLTSYRKIHVRIWKSNKPLYSNTFLPFSLNKSSGKKKKKKNCKWHLVCAFLIVILKAKPKTHLQIRKELSLRTVEEPCLKDWTCRYISCHCVNCIALL